MAGVICLCGCKSTSHEEPLMLRNLSDYANLGTIHNQMMVYAESNFIVDETIVDDEIGEYINSWVAESIELFVKENNVKWQKEVNLYDNHLNANQLKNRLRRSETRAIQEIDRQCLESNEISLDEAILIAQEYESIDAFESTKLREIGDKLLLNAEGLLSSEDLKLYLLEVAEEWQNQKYNSNSETGQVLGMILAVSLASLDYWSNNPELMAQTRVLPVWVGCDIAGAAIGGLVNIGLACYNDREIDWASVGDSVVVGAVTGSLGLVGKIGKWISRIF